MHKSVLGISGRIIVDHRDGDGLNNQQHNLRKASKAQNGQNSQKRVCPTSSKFKGVTWDKARGKWQAKICAGYNRVALGRFELEEDAARAYDAAAEKMHGEFAKVNFDNRLEKSNMIA